MTYSEAVFLSRVPNGHLFSSKYEFLRFRNSAKPLLRVCEESIAQKRDSLP